MLLEAGALALHAKGGRKAVSEATAYLGTLDDDSAAAKLAYGPGDIGATHAQQLGQFNLAELDVIVEIEDGAQGHQDAHRFAAD